MRTPPADLEPADVVAVLAVEWGLRDIGLNHAPVGFGGHHWTVDVAGRPVWFVTANRPSPALGPAFGTAAALRDAGLPFVVAPVASELGQVVETYRGYAFSVTPWLADAVHHAGSGPDVVALAASLHDATNMVRGLPGTDDLAIEARDALDTALDDAAAGAGTWSGPYADGVRDLLAGAGDQVRAALAAYDERAARVDRGSLVVTHGELKPGNLLATPDGVALVDWDTALLAPPERDLWWLPAADHADYTARTGRPVDPDVLEVYRSRWDLTDTALAVAELRAATARNSDTDTSWEVLRGLWS